MRATLAKAESTAASAAAPTTTVVVSVVPRPPATYLGMLPGQRLRFEQPGSKGATEALLDSIVGDRVFLRRPLDDYTTAPTSIAIGEARHLQVKRGASRIDNAGSAMHFGSQLAWAVPMVAMARVGSQERGFRAGAIASAAVIPIAFVVGSAFAPSRWAPLEAQRSGSPLMVDDRLRVRQVGASGRVSGRVSGRLVDMDATHLYLRDGRETFRVPRANVVSVDRAQGYDWKARALYGAAVGAMLGFLNVSNCACRPTRERTLIVPATSALVGLLAAPALAPRRWLSVTSW